MRASLTLTAALENLAWACACTHHIARRLRKSSARPIDPLARACSVSGPSTCSSIIMYRRGATKVLIMPSRSHFSFTHHHAHSPHTGVSSDCRVCDDNTAIICRPASKRRTTAEKAEYAEACTVLGEHRGFIRYLRRLQRGLESQSIRDVANATLAGLIHTIMDKAANHSTAVPFEHIGVGKSTNSTQVRLANLTIHKCY